MAKKLNDIIGGLPEGRRARIDARADALRLEVRGRQALHQLAGRTQEQLADSRDVQ